MTETIPAQTTMAPLRARDVPEAEAVEGSRFAIRYRELTPAGGGSHVGVCLEELPPGKQNCPQHYHLLEEEHLYVLSGALEVLLDDQRHPMGPGDYICFPAGRPVAHALFNPHDTPCHYLIIGERNPADVIIYPENNRVSVRLTGEGYAKTPVDYWTGIARD